MPQDSDQTRTFNLKDQFTEVTTFSKIAAAVVFGAMPFVGFYLGTTYAGPTMIVNQLPSPVQEVKSQEVSYKKAYLNGEIPTTWSEYNTSDINWIYHWPVEGALQKHVVSSVASDAVTFYDWNASQIDLYILLNDAGKEYLKYIEELAKTDSQIRIEDRVISGAQSKVVTWPLDNGEVTKVGSGGQSVLISTGTSTDSQYILINKQAKGDESFEKDFAHYLDTMKLSEL